MEKRVQFYVTHHSLLPTQLRVVLMGHVANRLPVDSEQRWEVWVFFIPSYRVVHWYCNIAIFHQDFMRINCLVLFTPLSPPFSIVSKQYPPLSLSRAQSLELLISALRTPSEVVQVWCYVTNQDWLLVIILYCGALFKSYTCICMKHHFVHIIVVIGVDVFHWYSQLTFDIIP